jgi:hypothetical protein
MMKRLRPLDIIIGLGIVIGMVLLLLPTWVEAKTVCRDAKTGQYVSHKYAKKYPGLTVCTVK